MKKSAFIGILLGLTFTAQSQVVKYGNEFLSLGVGARNIAMGEATISGLQDASALYYHPAALTQLEHTYDILAMHNEQFAGIGKHDFIAAAARLQSGDVLSAGFMRYGIDNIPNTLYLMSNGQIDYTKLKLFSAVDYAFFAGYAKKTSIPGLSLGANVKIIRRVIGDFASAWGFGADLSAQYVRKSWRFAVIGKDITTTFDAWKITMSDADKAMLVSAGNALPQGNFEWTLPHVTLAVGRAWDLFQHRMQINAELASDMYTAGKRNTLISSSWLNADPRVGLELGYKNMVFVRAGMNRIQKITGLDGNASFTINPSVGAGIRLRKIALDYAIANPSGSLLGASNIISLRLYIDADKK